MKLSKVLTIKTFYVCNFAALGAAPCLFSYRSYLVYTSTAYSLCFAQLTESSGQFSSLDKDDLLIVSRSRFPPKLQQHSLRSSSSSSSSSSPDSMGMEHGFWLPRLRRCKEQGQRQWSAFVAQRRHLLTMLAPFQWTRLAETLSHDR